MRPAKRHAGCDCCRPKWSDFEKDSENTDAGDEEADEDPSEVDKKTNNPLTSQPVMIIKSQQNKHIKSIDKTSLPENLHIFQWRWDEDAADTQWRMNQRAVQQVWYSYLLYRRKEVSLGSSLQMNMAEHWDGDEIQFCKHFMD